MRFRIPYFAVLLGFVLSPLCLDAQKFVCPPTLSVQQIAARVPPGWNAISLSNPPSLDRVAFYLSNPAEGASLIPDGRSVINNEEQVTWTFKRSSGDEFWLGCIYVGSRVILAKKLTGDVTACVVRYDLLPSGSRLRINSIICR
jgi:hypothetical protein